MGFALNATDLLTVLHRFYPDAPASTVRASVEPPADSTDPAAATTQLSESSSKLNLKATFDTAAQK